MAARFTSTLEPLAIANGRSSRFNTSQHKKEEKKGSAGQGTSECMRAYCWLLRFRALCVVVRGSWSVILLLLLLSQ